MDYLTHKYIGIISTRLEKFKRRGPELYNFRCILCGDSQTNKNKARAYFYTEGNRSNFHCHNCGASSSIENFIKKVDQGVYNEMRLERLRGEKTPDQKSYEEFVNKLSKPIFLKEGPLKCLKKISQLKVDHPVKKFVEFRKIPTPYHAKLFVCPNFMRFVNELVPGKFDESALKHDETRLLIPFFDKEKNLHAFQGRSLNPKSKAKYITIILDESKPKIYGLDAADFGKPVYVFEGPIDSMFINNGIAAAGSDLITAVSGFSKEHLVLVFDNEPRSKEICSKIEKAILNGFSVVIWPSNYNHKDINDAVLAGLSPEFLSHILRMNTYKDLAAMLAFKQWRKC